MRPAASVLLYTDRRRRPWFHTCNDRLWMSCLGVTNGIIQGFFFESLVSELEPKTLFRIGYGAFVLIFGLFPIIHMIGQRSGIVGQLGPPSMPTSPLRRPKHIILMCTAVYHCVSTKSQNTRCCQWFEPNHGINSSSRAIEPALATSIFAYSVQHNLVGGYAVYLVMISITLATAQFGAMLPVEPGK